MTSRTGRRRDQARDDQRAGWTPVRLELGRVDPVVAGHRVGQDHDLAVVGRIGQELAPAGGRRREDEVALGRNGPRRGGMAAEDARRPRVTSRAGRRKRTPAASVAGGIAGGAGTGFAGSLLSGIAGPDLKDLRQSIA